jgi:hypothetical protein
MVLADLLSGLGVPGTLVSAAVVPFALSHFRSGFKFLSQVATWIYAMAVAFALVAIASTGLIPGIDLNPIVEVGRFVGWLGGIVTRL